MAKRPADLVGFYIPVSRETDFTNEVTDPKTGELVTMPSMAKQEFVSECDINNIIKEYLVTGQIQHVAARAAAGAFLDLPDHLDLQESMAIQAQATAAFGQLPSRVRERFANDPVSFLEFFQNPANREEAGSMGLLEVPPPPPEPTKVEIVNSAASPPSPEK